MDWAKSEQSQGSVAFARRAMLKPPRAWWSRPYGDCPVTRNKKAGSDAPCKGGFRVPAIIRWPGKVPAGKVENGIVSGLDWFPTLVAAAGDPNITTDLLQGKKVEVRNGTDGG
jgi:Sulfatase